MKILLAAKKLFADQGFEGTSVRQICEEAGANVALVSYHFGGKEKVLYALFSTFFPDPKEYEDKERFQDPVVGLRTLIREVIRFRMRDPELIQLLQQEIFKNSPRLDRIREHAHPVWRLLRALLTDGKNKGLFHFRSLDNTMFFVMGTLLFHKHADYFKPLLEESPPTYEELARDTLEFVFNGLGAPQYGKEEVSR